MVVLENSVDTDEQSSVQDSYHLMANIVAEPYPKEVEALRADAYNDSGGE